MEALYIALGVIGALLVIFLIGGYLKAPPDTA